METTYTWEALPDGGTLMTLRNRGAPAGITALAQPVLATVIRLATTKDLVRLKRLLESRAPG